MNNTLIVIALIAQVTLLILFKSEQVSYEDILRASIESRNMEMEAANKALLESTLDGSFLDYGWGEYEYDCFPDYSGSYEYE